MYTHADNRLPSFHWRLCNQSKVLQSNQESGDLGRLGAVQCCVGSVGFMHMGACLAETRRATPEAPPLAI